MGSLSLGNTQVPWALLLPIFSTLIGKIFPDPEKAAEAQLAMQKALNEAQAEEYKAQAIQDEAKKDIIVTEMGTSWAGNWRAYLMLCCISIIGYNWVVVSLLNAFLAPLHMPITAVPVPTELWTLVTVGLGGYIGKETMQSYSENKYGPTNDKKFFDVLRAKVFKSGMSQEQVSALEEALQARDNK